MKFTRHYTGLEYAEADWRGWNYYVSRNSGQVFRRISRRTSGGSRMLGLFLGRCNYLGGRGWELYTSGHRIGWSKDALDRRFFRVTWHGSMVKPWEDVTLRVGRFGVGCRTPKWLKRWKEKRMMQQYIEEYGGEE